MEELLLKLSSIREECNKHDNEINCEDCPFYILKENSCLFLTNTIPEDWNLKEPEELKKISLFKGE